MLLCIFLVIAFAFLVPVVIALAGLAPDNTVHHGSDDGEPDSADPLLAA